MPNYGIRFLRMIFGIAFYGCGVYMTIQANLGLSPWDALHMGINCATGLSFGNASVMVGLIILVADVLLGEKIGFGTIVNTIMIGKMVDFFNYIELLPKMENFFSGLVLLLAGLVIVCFGMYFYMGTGLGGGPRDSLMVALHRKYPKLPIGLTRTLLEGAALLSGWMLGGKVGIGTLVSVLSVGFIMQGVFALVRFDPKAVQHENLMVTINRMRSAQKI
ncbi:YczE/YyaS/YitT family protein [Oscillospiraceae bacterium LTW-04]|nr:hypothetical protein RBH76_12590 [Oscillospiraceae bacterium MB24-C1]